MKAALLLLAAIAVGGCADNSISLSIIQMQAITAPQCVAQNTVGVGIDRGVLDISLVSTQGYVAIPLVRNNQQSRITATGGIEFNSIQVTGARVTLSGDPKLMDQLSAAEKDFTWPAAAGHVDPGQLVPMFIEAVPAELTTHWKTVTGRDFVLTVLATIRPLGKASSDDVSGGPVTFPVDVCNGCFGEEPGSIPDCPFPAGTTPVNGGCFRQQDETAQCCQMGNAVLCGSAAPVAKGM